MPVPSSAEPYLAALPELRRVQEEAYATIVDGGIVEVELKQLCARYLADEPDVTAGGERERAALDWARQIAWGAEADDAELWVRLHEQFTEPELVELGYFIAFTLGQQHWLSTLNGREGA